MTSLKTAGSRLTAALLFITAALHGADSNSMPATTYTPAKDTLVYVGTYTGAKSKGIYRFKLQTENEADPANIPLRPFGLAAETPNPTFLAIDPARHLLFAANEIDTFEGKPSGAISSFAIDPATGKLTLINQRPSSGGGPCHLLLDATGRNILVANYGGGSVSVIRVAPDGRLGETTAFIQNHGKSLDPARQEGPHAHCVTLDAANRFVFVCDLGLDRVLIYRFDADHGTLTPAEPAYAAIKPGSGPRHLAFRPDGRFAYVFNELNSTITTFAYAPATGRLTEVATISSLPPGYTGKNSGAEIAVHPGGKFLYASNRGRNSIALLAIDPDKGTLGFVADYDTGGKIPRHFAFDPSATHLVIGNQNSDTILVTRIAADGRLQPSAIHTAVPSPVCAVFLPPTPDRAR